MLAEVLNVHQTKLPAFTIIILAEVYNETDVFTGYKNISIHKLLLSVCRFCLQGVCGLLPGITCSTCC